MSITRSLILRAEHKLHLFENKVLRKINGPTKNRVRNFRDLLHNEATHDSHVLKSTADTVRRSGHSSGGQKLEF
jgi:hypothetical protein